MFTVLLSTRHRRSRGLARRLSRVNIKVKSVLYRHRNRHLHPSMKPRPSPLFMSDHLSLSTRVMSSWLSSWAHSSWAESNIGFACPIDTVSHK